MFPTDFVAGWAPHCDAWAPLLEFVLSPKAVTLLTPRLHVLVPCLRLVRSRS